MKQRKSIPQSDHAKVFLLRLWFPFLIGAVVVGISWDNWEALWVLSPLILFALFLSSVAQVQAHPDGLLYRRLLRWETINYEQISGNGLAWDPFLGFLKLGRFLFPWGKLYFVLDGSLYENPFRKSGSELLRYVSTRVKALEHSHSATTRERNQDRRLILTFLMAGFAGVLVSLMVSLLFPEQTQFHPEGPDWPRWIVLFDQARTTVFSWPWNLLVFAAIIALMASRRNRQRAWVFAFIAGLMLPSLLLGWL